MSMDGLARPTTKIVFPLRWIYVCGPGLLVMLADTDAGNVVTGVQAGAQWGYRLLPLLLLLLLIPMLYMVQELTVRLGICTGRGHAELIRERFGVGWAWLSTAGLAAATIGSLVTNSPEWRGSENSMACRRSGPARCRCHRLLPASGTDRDRHRPVRARLFCRRLGRATEP